MARSDIQDQAPPHISQIFPWCLLLTGQLVHSRAIYLLLPPIFPFWCTPWKNLDSHFLIEFSIVSHWFFFSVKLCVQVFRTNSIRFCIFVLTELACLVVMAAPEENLGARTILNTPYLPHKDWTTLVIHITSNYDIWNNQTHSRYA